MSDGILQTHGTMLATIGGFLILVLLLVGEQGSPGVLSDVQEQAQVATPGISGGQPAKPDWFSPDPLPPQGTSQPERPDGVANASAFPNRLDSGNTTSNERGQPPASLGRPGPADFGPAPGETGSSLKDASGQPLAW